MFSSRVAVRAAPFADRASSAQPAHRKNCGHRHRFYNDRLTNLSEMTTLNKLSYTSSGDMKMSDAQSNGSKNLDVLRRDLKALRAKARESGVLTSQSDEMPTGTGGLSASRKAAMESMGPEDKGKQVATRLLAILRRGEKDDSPVVQGTNITEQGVQRLLRLMAAPRAQQGPADKIYQRIQNFLTTPPKTGGQLVGGVSPEKARLLAMLLQQIEKHGWEQVKAHQEQRAKPAAAPAAAEIAVAPPPRKPKRAGRM